MNIKTESQYRINEAMNQLMRVKKLNKEKLIERLNELVEINEANNKLYNELKSALNLCPENKFLECLSDTFNVALDLLAEMSGDKSEWIYWFIYENECGEKGHEAGYNGDTKPIKTVEDLAELILHEQA